MTGLLLSLAPILMLVFGLAEADVKALVTAIGNVVFLFLSIISAVMTVVGLLRKIKMGRWSASSEHPEYRNAPPLEGVFRSNINDNP